MTNLLYWKWFSLLRVGQTNQTVAFCAAFGTTFMTSTCVWSKRMKLQQQEQRTASSASTNVFSRKIEYDLNNQKSENHHIEYWINCHRYFTWINTVQLYQFYTKLAASLFNVYYVFRLIMTKIAHEISGFVLCTWNKRSRRIGLSKQLKTLTCIQYKIILWWCHMIPHKWTSLP